jgi:hypothetical protein
MKMSMFTMLVAISSLLSIEAEAQVTPYSPAPATTPSQPVAPTTPPSQGEDPELMASLREANAWLQLIDQENYPASWNSGSATLKFMMSQQEWTKYLEKMRKPLGRITSREMIQQRTAKDPKGAPKGDYVVIFYQTAFAGRPTANEQVIMIKETDGKWRPLSYFFR